MRYGAALPLVAAFLLGSASLPECAKAQTDPSRLIAYFWTQMTAPRFMTSCHSIAKQQVENYYGAVSPEATLAKNFYKNGGSGSAYMLFTRFPDEPGRAHLYGGNINTLSLAQLQAINGTLTITSEGYNYSGHVDLSTATGFTEAANRMTAALNKNLQIEDVITGSSIAPVSVSFTGSTIANVLTVNAVSSGSIQVGSIINGQGVPPGAQISAQLSGTPGGPGVYSLFLHGLSKVDTPIPTETMTDTYGVLTEGSELRHGRRWTAGDRRAGVLP